MTRLHAALRRFICHRLMGGHLWSSPKLVRSKVELGERVIAWKRCYGWCGATVCVAVEATTLSPGAEKIIMDTCRDSFGGAVIKFDGSLGPRSAVGSHVGDSEADADFARTVDREHEAHRRKEKG
jgi:hypothetical protein